ncbi:hypothetical protein [Cesiribacter sp. SM1]|uniref:hypothetical protein n=1 Tax=Cesiribacter sp. SM1 TaxID=2861196 RepID=UPI001CD1D192|nr:hypothetical protein [Cesiribacter sp. SM1]
MYKQRLSGLAICCLALFASCSDKDVQADNERLEKELAAEKSKTITALKKEGSELVITYSNGTSQRVAFTEAMQGDLALLNGQDGVGIQSITYNEHTGIMRITLTNGDVSEFKISGTGENWSAVHLGDTNGRLFLEEVMLGSVPVVKAQYNADYQLTYLESNQVVDLETRKIFDLSKNYQNGKLSSYVLQEYAERNEVKYSSVWHNYSDQYVDQSQYKGDHYTESNNDGTFTGYELVYSSSQETYRYRKYPNCISLLPGQAGYDDYVVSKKISDTEYKHYYHISSFDDEGMYVQWFQLWETITLEGFIEAGDIYNTEVVKLETDAEGRITRMYESVEGNEEPGSYIDYTYTAAGLIKDTKAYSKDEAGNWGADGVTLTYTYNSNNKLVSTTETDSEGNTKEIQKAVYDAQGNPTEIWAYTEAEWDWRYEYNPVTARHEELKILVREAGLHKVAILEYDYKLKNFFGNTITALVPELDGYKTVNALKRVTVPNNYSYGNMEYLEFDEYGYPSRVSMTGAYFEEDGDLEGTANLELLLKYKVKPKE